MVLDQALSSKIAHLVVENESAMATRSKQFEKIEGDQHAQGANVGKILASKPKEEEESEGEEE